MSTETISSSYSDLTTSYVDESLVASSTEAFDKVMMTMTTTESVSSELVSNDTESSTALVVEIANMTLKALSDNTDSTQKIDLQALWKWLEQGQNQNNIGNGGSVIGLNEANLQEIEAKASVTTWQLAIIQGVLLAMLVVLSVLWAFCCRRLRRGDQPLISGISEQVAALARKISSGSSRDLPPSYSKVDLTQIGLTINDHFNPPPHYDVCTDEDNFEDGRGRRIARFSLASLEAEAGIQPAPDRIRRGTSSNSLENSLPGIIRSGRFSVTSNTNSIVGSESETSSRRTSRVTFAPNLESGPTRRESSQSLPLQSALVTSKSRKSSSHSEGSMASRKVSFIDEITGKSARPDAVFEERLRSQLEMVREAGEMGEFLSSSPPESTFSNILNICKQNNNPEAVRLDEGKIVKQSTDPQTHAIKPNNEKSSCHLPTDDSKSKELFI